STSPSAPPSSPRRCSPKTAATWCPSKWRCSERKPSGKARSSRSPCASTPRGHESLIAVNDAALRPVRRADLQQHAVVLDYADVVLRHPSRHPREDLVPVGECHGVEAVPAHPGNGALGLDEVSSWHLVILLIAMAAASHSLPHERVLVLPRSWIHRRTCARPGIPGEAVAPRTSRAYRGSRRLGRTASPLRRATATFLEPQQAHRRP